MLRAPRRHRKAAAPAVDAGALYIQMMKGRVTNLNIPDTRSNVEFLSDIQAKQAAGRLVNPATAALLDRLGRAIR